MQLAPALDQTGLNQPGADPADAARDRLAEIVRSTYGYMPAVLAGYMAGVGVIALLFWGVAPRGLIGAWAAGFALMCLLRLVVVLGFARAAPVLLADWQRWCLRSNVGTLVAATMWGATGWVFFGIGTGLQQTGLILIVYTYCLVGIPILSLQRRLFLAFATLCCLPLVVCIARIGDAYHWQLAGELVLIFCLTAVLANSYRQALQRAIDLKLQADRLAALLRAETGAAQQARREAETANRAKTQFFTAASHDLRQPLHAMGLFAEALRQRVREPAGSPVGRTPEGEARRFDADPEIAHLVNSINESVDALEGLFSELLDITRIDSGGVEVHDQHFTVGDIFRKLRLHFEPGAFEKSLALRLRGGRHAVFADPLLVERILRNLVSNAIRYTDDGTVLVSCRRRGDQLLLQVWDTGVGISESEQARVFEEFYQVPGARRPDAEQRKGLGLGLAIVQRLAQLMQAALTMRSAVGHGTVFTLTLPLGKTPRTLAPLPSAKGPIDLTLDGRLVVIVEDEPAVREGLAVLITGWGARVAAFESAAETERWALASNPSVVRPDLLIVDFRLEEGRTGLDAIRALRGRFGAGVPAIVVTGSTMTSHEREAQEHDFHLLIKPVVPYRLRAMIGFKLRPVA